MSKHRRVDVVVSDPAVRESTRLLLELQQAEGRDFPAGTDFILKSLQDADCIVLDMELNDMSGAELVDHLRTSGDATPIVLLTANGHGPRTAEAVTLLRKPFAMEKLVSAIEAACAESKGDDEAAPFSSWINEARIGVEALDKEHDELAELVLDFYDAVLSDETGRALRQRFDALAAYTDAHFAHEENYMRFTGFPGRDKHIRAHERLKARLKEIPPLKGRKWNSRSATALAVLRFLKKWLVAHILNEDRELGAYLNSKNIR